MRFLEKVHKVSAGITKLSSTGFRLPLEQPCKILGRFMVYGPSVSMSSLTVCHPMGGANIL